MTCPYVCAQRQKTDLEALEKAKEYEPDILLVDILHAKAQWDLNFLEELKKLSIECKVIIISGFNEFAYAQQAITLGVSYYLLKPIADSELKEALESVSRQLWQTRKSRKFMNLMRQQFVQNKNTIRDVFFNDWINGNLSGKEWQEQREFLEIELPDTVMLILVSVQSGFTEKNSGGSCS